MQERINIEIHIVRHVHIQQLLEFENVTQDDGSTSPASSNDSTADNEIEPFVQSAESLLRRIGKANARRRQQFIYWRERSALIARLDPEPQMPETVPNQPVQELSYAASNLRPGHDKEVPSPSQVHSGPTSVTRLDPQLVKLDDSKSVITHSSRVSTAMGPKGEGVVWPDPPSYLTSDKFFICQYCMTICPERYLGKEQWK
jgi:hypothetical protein